MNRVLFQADSSDTDYHERIFIKLTQHAERENSICIDTRVNVATRFSGKSNLS